MLPQGGKTRQTHYQTAFTSAVSQNQSLKVEIKGFKTSHFLEQKTAPRDSPDAGPMEDVELPKSERLESIRVANYTVDGVDGFRLTLTINTTEFFGALPFYF